jgi:thioredoxin-related protein
LLCIAIGEFAEAILKKLLWILLVLLVPASPVAAAELVMLEQPGCVWCERWHEEIGVAYPKTEEGHRAPIRFVDISKAWPSDLDWLARERLTPTFILVEDGAEVARLRGYPGDIFFWPLLGEMLDKLTPTARM